ncbi:MAG: universal stress protein [Gammaproteobacteria bacterium]|nr:universal stress protein [Gammaproteobacteria bacterium]NNK32524.1 universal stress protein [Xanthomonadales bacterium]
MQRFKNILCVVNRGNPGGAALERAAALAESNQARLTVAVVAPHVSVGMGIPENGPLSRDLQAAEVKACREKLARAVDALDRPDSIATDILVGIQFLEIIRAVLRDEYDLVIKTAEQAEWLESLFGSEDMHLLRKCPCPVWLVNPFNSKQSRRIIAAVDVSDAHPAREAEPRKRLNRKILELASSMALADFAELHVVHAWEAAGVRTMRGAYMHATEETVRTYVDSIQRQRESGMKKLMGGLAESLDSETMKYLSPEVHLENGPVREVIPSLAKDIEADLIVMGTVARTGVPGFIIGNTAESILRQIECSVLAVKPEGFETPVTL